MDYHEVRRGFWDFRPQLKMTNLKLKVACILCFALCAFLCISCGEKENKNLVNARDLIQQGKYKESQDVTALRSELDLVLSADAGDTQALCPRKALDIIGSGANAATQQKAVEEIIKLVTSVEAEIKKLDAIDKDLLTDDDKDKLEKLNRQWVLSLEPSAIILKSQTGWISNVGQPAVDLLIELLKTPNPAIQDDIVDLFVSFKDLTFDALIKALQNPNDMVRRHAVIALGKIGDERAIEPITERLNDEAPGVRFYVPVALDMIGGEKIIEPMHEALKNEMAKVRTAAANILGKIEDEAGIDSLMNLLADNDSYAKTSAINALTKIGKPAVPKLIAVLETDAENITLPPTEFIGDKIGNEYKKVLAKRAALEVSAASILGNINDPRAVAPLIEVLKKKASAEATEEEKANVASIRSGAAAALTVIGPAAVEPLISILESPTQDEETRIQVISILGGIGDKRSVEPLIAALKEDSKKSIRSSSAASLGLLIDRRAVPALIAALKDEDVVTRANAAASLGTIKDKRATQPLIDVIMDETEREKIRSAAIGSLGTIKDTLALDPLVKILIDEYEKEGIRKSAASALRVMENAWASEALIGLLKGEVVYGIFMPEKGSVSRWVKKEGDGNMPGEQILEVSAAAGKTMVEAPARGKLVKIYIKAGEEAEAKALLGLISYDDRDIDQEERSSIRSAAAYSLGKVKGENALEALLRSVRKDKSAAVRKNAATALWELDKADARSTLIKVLKGDDSGSVRSNAALALGKGAVKGASAVSPLINALQNDKYDSTRENAAWSLGEINNEGSVTPLVSTVVEGRKGKEESSAVVNQVITALDKQAAKAVDQLIDVLEDKEIDEVPRSIAARILGLIESANAIEPLKTALKDESVVVRSEAAKSLGLIVNRSSREALVEVLVNEDEWITTRANAATALQRIKDELAVEPLIKELSSEITAIRSNAVLALGPLQDKRATLPLMQIVENEAEDDTIRANAIVSIGTIGDSQAVDVIMAALKSDNITMRQKAADALGALEVNAAVEPLMEILRDMSQPVVLRTSAATALGKIGDDRVAPLLRQRLDDKNESDAVWKAVGIAAGKLRVSQVSPWVSERAYDTWELAAVRSAAFKALTASVSDLTKLVEMLSDATVAIRSGAALALGETGNKDAIQPLIEKMQKDGEEAVRRDSAIGLASLADPSSEQALIKAHQEDATASVRIQSALALGNIKGQAGIAALIKTVQDTSIGRNIRANSAKALGNAGSAEAVPALKTALEDNLAVVHFEAAEALRKITGENYGYER